ncbi:MAG: hypothetical protein U0932_01090 [Thiobacillus sp.]|nr:hypothetical protein [Thiobacillus sp.]
MKINPTWVLWGIGAGAALLVLNSLLGGRILSAAAGAAARAPGDIFMGGVEGMTGLPDTRTADSKNKCRAALEAGDDWAASFYCPAGTWWGGLFDGK